MLIFVFDVGNTNIVLGVYDQDELKHHWRIETNRNKTEDEYGMIVKSLFEHVNLSFSDIDGIIISSVVPPIMFSLERMCQKYFHVKPLVVGPGIKTGLVSMILPGMYVVWKWKERIIKKRFRQLPDYVEV